MNLLAAAAPLARALAPSSAYHCRKKKQVVGQAEISFRRFL